MAAKRLAFLVWAQVEREVDGEHYEDIGEAVCVARRSTLREAREVVDQLEGVEQAA